MTPSFDSFHQSETFRNVAAHESRVPVLWDDRKMCPADGEPVAMETKRKWRRAEIGIGGGCFLTEHQKRKSRVGGGGFLKRETMAAGCGQVDRSGVRSKSGGRKKKFRKSGKGIFFWRFSCSVPIKTTCWPRQKDVEGKTENEKTWRGGGGESQ